MRCRVDRFAFLFAILCMEIEKHFIIITLSRNKNRLFMTQIFPLINGKTKCAENTFGSVYTLHCMSSIRLCDAQRIRHTFFFCSPIFSPSIAHNLSIHLCNFLWHFHTSCIDCVFVCK